MTNKILLIEDELDLVEVTKIRLKNSGYEVVSALSGEKALASLQKDTPDLILLDLVLPNIQGDEVCRRLKSNDKLKCIPVILYSSKGNISEEAKRVCADDCMVKPFEAQDLLAKIKKIIG